MNPQGSPLPSLYLSLFMPRTKLAARQSLPNTFPVVSSRDFKADQQDVAKESNGCSWQFILFIVLPHWALTRHMVSWFVAQRSLIELVTEYISFILVSGKVESSWK